VSRNGNAIATQETYRMPAEWARHQATWLSWPHNPDTWPGRLHAIEEPMSSMVRALAEVETVHINVLDGEQERYLDRLLRRHTPSGRVVLHRIPTNDAWCRDHGAIFVSGGSDPASTLLALKFGYNAWGGKYTPFDLDQRVAEQMAAVLGVPCVEHTMVLEGGSVDVNGAGALLTTEQCLLNSNRNPGMSREAIEAVLRSAFGIAELIWLGAGIEGDDTDGHIDEISRFVAERTVVTAVESEPAEPNYAPLQSNRHRLESFRFAAGGKLEVIDLPMPEPIFYRSERLPASYANFYIANEIVLVPAFGVTQDQAAVATLADCFPDRRMVPIDCRDLVVGLGGLHCLTQQVPTAGLGLS
jgi:agmatine deiminase